MIAGDSKVHILSKLAEPMAVIEAAKGGGYPLPIFTMEDHITVGWLDRLVSMGKSEVLSVTLDDGSALKVTPDQKFLLLDGSYCKASELQPGKSLMPLYLSTDKQGYPMFEELNGYNLEATTSMDCQRVRKVSRMVAESKLGSRLLPKTTVSHIDGDRKNCHPGNLKVTVNPDAKQRNFVHPFAKSLKEAIDFIKANPKNHKVSHVSDAGTENVYGCASVQNRNIAVNGVFLGTIDYE